MFSPPKKEVCEGNAFTSVCHSFHRGVGLPVCITGHITRGVCIQGGLLPREVCIRGVCNQGKGSASGGSASRGWADPPYHLIQSTSGGYASYWNAFLFQQILQIHNVAYHKRHNLAWNFHLSNDKSVHHKIHNHASNFQSSWSIDFEYLSQLPLNQPSTGFLLGDPHLMVERGFLFLLTGLGTITSETNK